MSQRTEWLVEIDVTTVTNDTEGYKTPLTAVTTSPTYGAKTLKFGSLAIESDQTGYQRCIEDFNLNTPELKTGLGLASRATATIGMLDFVGDPDPDTPAVINDPDTIKRGTYFSKLNARHILVNRTVRFIGIVNGLPAYQYEFLVTDFKQTSSNKWTLTCRDVLYKLEDKKTVFPKAYSANVTNIPSTGGGSVTLNGPASEWNATKNVAVSGSDVMPINSVSGTSTTILAVTRGSTYTIGTRTYVNDNSDIRQGESVFRGRKYVNASLSDIIIDIFEDSGITSANYNATQIQTEVDNWVGVQNITCLFTSPMESVKVLNNICQTFLIDIYTTPDNQIKVTGTSPFESTTVRFFEGREITYGKGTIDISDDLRFSRSLLSYGKRKQTDDETYAATSFKFNSEYESSAYYDDEKLFTFESSDLLTESIRGKEIADTTCIRFVNRWVFRPLVANLEINKTAFDQINIGETLFIEHSQVQLPSGAIDTNKRYQVTKLRPLKNGFYNMKAVSYLPYFGTASGYEYDPVTGEITAVGAITINDNKGINLFTEAGSPEPAAQLSEYTFILDSNVLGEALGNDNKPASIIFGEGWNSNTTFNIVCLNGVVVTSTGGNGGAGGVRNGDGIRGSDGGNVITSTDSTRTHTLNIYLSGSRTVQSVSYTCDGYLLAPGGGGGGGAGLDRQKSGAGGGGAGFPAGESGSKRLRSDPSGARNGTTTLGGDGESANFDGGDGGDSGNSGLPGQNSASATGGLGGAAGKALVKNGSIVNIFGSAGRLELGTGDAPNSTPA